MKLALLAALLLSRLTLAAQSTDAMPPEQIAPTQQAPTQQAPAQQAKPMASMPMHGDAKPPVAPSHSLTITYDGKSVTLSMQDLLAMPQQSVTAHDGHTHQDVSFSGPLVADVLARAGLPATDASHKTILHSTVVATGTDGYFVLYSAAELEPSFSSGKAIVALMRAGDLPNTAGGDIQLISPADIKPARWVHGLATLTVMTLAPAK
jgi:hypothetical protein